MLNIPEEVRDLFKENEYTNYRIQFPFDDIADVTNAQIEDDSVSFDESICSQSPLKFGVCEASGFAFTGIALPNIKGKTIDVSIEIDCQRLKLYNVYPDYVEYKTDINKYIYSVPIGRFIVNSCEREAGSVQRRKVQAYSEDYYNYGEELPAEYRTFLETNLKNKITTITEDIADLFVYLTKTYTSKQVFKETTWNTGRTLRFYLKVPGYLDIEIEGYTLIESDLQSGVVMTEYGELDWEDIIPSAIHNYIVKYELPSEEENAYIERTIEIVRGYFRSAPDKAIYYKNAGNACIPISITISAKHYDVLLPSEKSYLVVRYNKDTANEHNIKLSHLNEDSITDLRDGFVNPAVHLKIEEMLKKGFAREFVESYVELAASFGKRPRGPEKLQLIKLKTTGGLYPANDLYPARDLYPSANGEGFSLTQRMYSDAWVDESPTLKYSSVYIKYKDENDTDQYITETIVDLTEVDESGNLVHNPDEYQVYDASDNWIARNGHSSSYESGRNFPLMRIAAMNLAETLKNIQYYPFKADCVGLPYVEAGDVVEVHTDEGYYTSVILQRHMQGIQNITDSYESKE